MEILENLYDCAERHLASEKKDWERFAHRFKTVFESQMVLYHLHPDPKTGLPVEGKINVIAASDMQRLKDYIEAKAFEHHLIPEGALAPLEPHRRSDLVSNETFEAMEFYYDACMQLGSYYQMISPAILPDNTFLGLVVYRTEAQGDFSNLEKQRLALFMRHLLALVGTENLVAEEPDKAIKEFARRFNLTAAELEILHALLNGQSLREISQSSGRTYGTVRWHVQNILDKCQVTSQKNLLREFYLLIKA